MSDEPERSFQQLDPVTVYSARPVTLAFSICIILYAAIETFLGWPDIVHPLIELGGFALLGAAAAAAVVFSSPQRAPFPGWAFGTIVFVVVVAMTMDGAASAWPASTVPPGDWGPVVVGVVLVQLAHYRPPREIAVATVFAAVAAGFMVVLHPTTAQTVSSCSTPFTLHRVKKARRDCCIAS